ncbi:sensor histidine kinase [Paenibacillus sp. CAA11]|uniref:HAMP domain-containing sensor histidine kinase n=1 Tax=Paenibacillus sp. CAA11 TaxID=1532905 RepID=UPI000D3734F9|nr:HAMP domain-containing sensor histidine kinase [Paenibacillus sp. CAA11]AWB43494.1 sensor histidine kinase [Paenibacillus sp. CAA11]
MEITQQKPGRKPTKLRTLFLRYLTVFCMGTIGLALLLALILYIFMVTGAIFPANFTEKQVAEAKSAILAGQELPKDSSYVSYKYAKYNLDGKLLEGTMSAKKGAAAWRTLQNSDSSYSFPYNYMKVTHGQEVYIFLFSITAQFNSELLRRFLPSAELTFFVIFCIAFLIGAALLASSFGRKLARKMNGLQEATQKIQQQDLDFSIQYSGIAEIDHVLQSVDQMKEALKNSLQRQWNLERSRREQISALAHDVKTPLTIVRGNVELLAETDQTEEQQGYTDYIAESARQMESYIKTLIEITKTESSTSLQPVTLNLQDFIDRMEGQMQALSVVKQLSSTVTTRSLPDTLYADPVLLERALMNIISNAVDQAPEGSGLTLIVEAVSDRIRFSVLDEGPGFSPEALKQATEQFYMGDSSRRSSGHYGMGLYITKFIAHLHGGKLLIANSDKTGGGQVSIEVPLKL